MSSDRLDPIVAAVQADLERLGIREHPGFTGAFTTQQADGAHPNGTRVVKVVREREDANPIGTRATVLGSLRHVSLGTMYFVEWDTMPKHAVAVIAWKIKSMGEG